MALTKSALTRTLNRSIRAAIDSRKSVEGGSAVPSSGSTPPSAVDLTKLRSEIKTELKQELQREQKIAAYNELRKNPTIIDLMPQSKAVKLEGKTREDFITNFTKKKLGIADDVPIEIYNN